jgi:hypothetical protein
LDWSGPVAIIASGPSAKKANIPALRGKMPVIAIKENVELAPWADVVYGCDAAWWKKRLGLQEFKGLKVTWAGSNDHRPAPYLDIRHVEITIKSDDLIFEPSGKLGSGGNSGFQALNLAVQFGAKRVLLIGFDMHDRSGAHWYGRNNWPQGNNPTEDNFRRWRRAFELAAPKLKERGVEVFNASDISVLRCFERRKAEDFVADLDSVNA